MTRYKSPARTATVLVSSVLTLACRGTPVPKLSDAQPVGCWQIAEPLGVSAKYGADTVFGEVELSTGSFTSQRPDIHRARLGVPTDSFTTTYWHLVGDSTAAVVVYSWGTGGLSLELSSHGVGRDSLDGVVRFRSETVDDSVGIVGLAWRPCRADAAHSAI
jgi:hypothetical protein